MKEYNFREIESHWQEQWQANKIYQVEEDASKPPFYVLDMFPYPSGAGLHVGHPLGYIASDIYARYKRLKGFNVLHPMGYDSFGLPAEQYAIQTGQHPEVTTKINTERYTNQMKKIGFSFDWSRMIQTCDPDYYKWTQWVFVKMFHSYYDYDLDKAMPIEVLIQHFEKSGSSNLNVASGNQLEFSAQDWQTYSEKERQEILLNYRLAYLGDTMVNWCPALGTVLANDEVSEGRSVRGGHEVIQRVMRQWCLRVSAYAERLLKGLESLQWSDALKEIQRNWIGKSEGAEIDFRLYDSDIQLRVFTTRADTIFGVTFMVLAPESDYVSLVTKADQKAAVEAYLDKTKKRTERDRIADRHVSGVFTGSYAINPLNGEKIPVWISDYVLAGYGTGAIMAVPAHDSRDFAFARHFSLPIRQVVLLDGDEHSDPLSWKDAKDSKEGIMINSDFLNGKTVKEAIAFTKSYIQEKQIGEVRVNYRLRDAIFSRQRYWGEPFPIYYKEGVPYTLDKSELPLRLPEIDKFLPTEDGEPPLGRATNWTTAQGYPFELSTMPGFAGSSAYYLRYMDPKNPDALVDPKKNAYWRAVDLYVGGGEHATGHLIYSRFWNKFLFDLGLVVEDEPFRQLVNQGMIQGRSNFVYRIKDTNTFVSFGLKEKYDVSPIHVDVNIVKNDVLDIEAFKAWRPEFTTADFILEDGKYICGWAVEKMSKSMFNVVNPDDIIDTYGADTLRLYEMFLGPLDQSKPWDTNGIDGVFRFLKKFWNLYQTVEEKAATKEEQKVLHKLIKKVGSDIESFSFNTSVPAFMIATTEFTKMKTTSVEVLRPMLILISPFAPHIAEELWHKISPGEVSSSVITSVWPEYDEAYLVESKVKYPISINGKVRSTIEVEAKLEKDKVEELALSHPDIQKWIDGAKIKKVIVVPGRIVNIVL